MTVIYVISQNLTAGPFCRRQFRLLLYTSNSDAGQDSIIGSLLDSYIWNIDNLGFTLSKLIQQVRRGGNPLS